jgi:cytochrome P450
VTERLREPSPSQTRSALAAALAELGIDRDSHRVLGLLPLVYVAWADGKVQRAERAVIERVARDKGWLGGRGGDILKSWLDSAPSADYVEKGLGVLASLARVADRPGPSVRPDTLRQLVAYCSEVAHAAGGLFGLAEAVDPDEDEALVTIADAFHLQGGGTWREIADDAAVAPGRPLPPGPAGHFLLGSLTDFLADPLAYLLRMAREHGDVVRFRMPGDLLVQVWRPEHIEHVLVTHKDNYVRGKQYDDLSRATGRSMLTTDGEEWRRARRIAQPAFHAKRIAGFADVIVSETHAMLERWQPRVQRGETIEILEEMMRLTLTVIGWLACSTELGDESSQVGEAVAVALRHVQNVLNNPLRLPASFPTPENLRFRRAVRVFDDLVYGLIDRRRAQPEDQRPADLLSLLVDARDEETGEALSDEELRNELLTFLIAGHETTALALTWLFYLLAKTPPVTRRIQAEIGSVLGGSRPTTKTAQELVYTRMAIDEAMRLYPPAPIVSRRSIAEDEIAGWRIPPNCTVVMSQWVTHRAPELWDDPEGFDPERFAEAQSAGRPRLAYFPFGAGPHKCIGERLALLELELIVPMILQRYKLELLPGFEPGLEPSITLRPKNGMPMRVR